MKLSLSIDVAYNNDPGWFEIVNNSMVRYPVYNVEGVYSNIPYDFEILEIFFKTKNVIVHWINFHYTWGRYDDETGRWTGAVGKVKTNTFPLK